MPILRVRTGCAACRRRKKKCDERKPICSGCARNGLDCEWPALSRPTTSKPRHGHPAAAAGSGQELSISSSHAARPARNDDECLEGTRREAFEPSATGAARSPLPVPVPFSNYSTSPSTSPSSSTSVRADLGAGDSSSAAGVPPLIPLNEDTQLGADDLEDWPLEIPASDPPAFFFQVTTPTTTSIARNESLELASWPPAAPTFARSLSAFPGIRGAQFELLRHYISMTSPTMDNGSKKTENPFSSLLIPFALSSDLILHLILTQSAVHRAARQLNNGDSVASEYYQQSLRLFRQDAGRVEDGQGQAILSLATGALIMCFVETAKGDVNGAIFDHLLAAQPLLVSLLQRGTDVPESMVDFLVEYYVYASTLSLVSIDTRMGPEYLIDSELESRAYGLVATSYVGSMCGCWLDLLLQIPGIFHLAHQFRADEAGDPYVATADDMILFAHIHSRIQMWQPNPSVDPDVATAGRIFQQALLIYLYTALSSLSPSDEGFHATSQRLAVDCAFAQLTQLAPDAHINTGLCWPIIVIGTCVTDVERQFAIQARLQTMFATLGLGNIHRASMLLSRIWEIGGANPWMICHIMQESHIWISFA